MKTDEVQGRFFFFSFLQPQLKRQIDHRDISQCCLVLVIIPKEAEEGNKDRSILLHSFATIAEKVTQSN